MKNKGIREELKSISKTFNLRHIPTATRSRMAAFELAEQSPGKLGRTRWVILGDNDWFWIVCPADADKLIKAGYELAE